MFIHNYIGENRTDRLSEVRYQRSQAAESAKESEQISFSKELKDYEDKMLTGMTEEEWNELKALCKKYLEDNPIETEADMTIFQNYVKKLLKEYGFKGDLEEFTDCLISDVEKGSKEKTNEWEEKAQKIEDASVNKAETQVVEEADGTKYLIIATGNGQQFKVKLSTGKEFPLDPDASNTKKEADGVKSYENNFHYVD